jgi:hypothetical protein
MDRYTRLQKAIDELPVERRIFCRAKQCACMGCLNSLGVSEHIFKLYMENKLVEKK